MKPIDARTFKQICSLPRDNTSTKDYWLQLDEGAITLAKQQDGKAAEWMETIPKAQFDRLMRWYVTGSIRRPSTGNERKGKE